MAESYNVYTGNGATNSFALGFGYLTKSHVHVYVNSVEDLTYTWITDSSIACTTTPPNGATVIVARETPRSALVTSIPVSGTLRGDDVNRIGLQALYVAQEAYDDLSNTIQLDTADNKWNAASKVIKNVSTPTNANDAANKSYVDTGANAAAASAAAAATSATNASNSATAAASSASAAAASYDSFDDRYLGAKAANPTLDNDGNALLTGAIYWNSTLGELRFYNGSAWETYAPAANRALDNLTGVAINAALLPGTTNTIALGSTTKTWAGLFLGEATSIRWGDNVRLDTGTDSWINFKTEDTGPFTTSSFSFGTYAATAGYASMVVTESHNNDGFGEGYYAHLARKSGASKAIVNDGDEIGLLNASFWDGAAWRYTGYIGAAVNGTPGAGDMPTRLIFATSADGAAVTNANAIELAPGSAAWRPTVDGLASLGSSGKGWSNLFLTTGAVINLGGDITLTHSADTLTMAGGNLVVNGDISRVNGSYSATMDNSSIRMNTPSGASAALRLSQSGIADWTITNVATTGVLAFAGGSTMEHRHGTTACAYRIYNTYTDAANYERFEARWATNNLELYATFAGTGIAREVRIGTTGAAALNFTTNNTRRWVVDASGHFTAVADNTYDIGASGATRPRDLHLARQLVMAGGTVTASTPLLNLTQTWNNAAVAFTGISADFTNTASLSTSNVIDLKVGGVSMFSVRRDGWTSAASSLNCTSGVGINGGAAYVTWNETSINREAASQLGMRNGTNACTFRVYNTYTDAANYERADIGWQTNRFTVDATYLGTGSRRAMDLKAQSIQFATGATSTTARWNVLVSGHFTPEADNSYDIGSSSNRVKDLYVAGVATLANTGLHLLDTDSSHDLIVKPGSNLTADRTLTFVTGDADRTITINSDITLASPSSTLLTSGTVSAAASLDLNLSSYTGYRAFKIILTNFIPATDGVSLYMRLSSDGTTFDSAAGNYSFVCLNAGDTSASLNLDVSGSATHINLSGTSAPGLIGNAATEGYSGEIIIFAPDTATAWPRVKFSGSVVDSNATPRTAHSTGSGTREAAQDTDGAQFLFSSGNISSGGYAVYGIT